MNCAPLPAPTFLAPALLGVTWAMETAATRGSQKYNFPELLSTTAQKSFYLQARKVAMVKRILMSWKRWDIETFGWKKRVYVLETNDTRSVLQSQTQREWK
jgi:hypothetical protein